MRESSVDGDGVCSVADTGLFGPALNEQQAAGDVEHSANGGVPNTANNGQNGDCQDAGRSFRGGQDGRMRKFKGEGDTFGMADDIVIGMQAGISGPDEREKGLAGESFDCGVPGFSPWDGFRLIYCRDGKVRRIPAKSLLFGMADGVSESVDGGGLVGISETGGFPLTTQKEGRAMLLKGYGNAIVPQVAAEFVMAFAEALEDASINKLK